jgi:hypothetical protein
MRTLASIILIFICVQWADGQWYNRSCGVSDINITTAEEFDCLWKKSNTIAKVGGITSIAGTAVLVTGAFTMIAADPCSSSGKLLIGYFTALTGAAIDIIGVPIWMTGVHRKSILRNNPHYNEQAFKAIIISPSLQRNVPNQYCSFGITASLCF